MATTARGLATVYGALATAGRLAGTRLVSGPKRSSDARAAASHALTCSSVRWWGGDFQWGLGFMLNHLGARAPTPRVRPRGPGGSYAFADPENRVSYAYVMNQMSGGTMGEDLRSLSIVQALYAGLGCLRSGR